MKLLMLSIGLSFMLGNALASEPKMIFWHYQVESINSELSNQACQDLFQLPLEYHLSQDSFVLETKNPIELENAKIVHQTALRRYVDLIHLSVDVKMKQQPLIEDIYYVLNHHQHQLKGNFVLQGFCKGQILGVETHY